jgi:hypothetical protein
VQHHDVVRDGAGFHNRTRLTCRTAGCNGATLLRQPFMTESQWQKAKTEFLRQHPCVAIRDIG